jgi:prevent-host-death family protein
VKQVNVYEARGQFSKLLEEVEAGEEIVIARNGRPIVRLLPVEQPKRVLGRWKGQTPLLSEEDWRESDEAVAALFAEAIAVKP